MDNRFWIKKHRKVLTHWLMDDSRWYQAWDILLLEADNDGVVSLADSRVGKPFHSKRALDHFLNKLLNEGMLEDISYGKGRGRVRTYRIINYFVYQHVSTEVATPSPAPPVNLDDYSESLPNLDNSVPYDEKDRWRRHLIATTGVPKIVNWRNVKDAWVGWYKTFGEDFIEVAWDESALLAANSGKNRPFAFLDLMNDYGKNERLANLARHILSKRKTPEPEPALEPTLRTGQQVTYDGHLWTVIDVASTTAYLESPEGTAIQVRTNELS